MSLDPILDRNLYRQNTENSQKPLKTVFFQIPSDPLRAGDLKPSRAIAQKVQEQRMYADFCSILVKIG